MRQPCEQLSEPDSEKVYVIFSLLHEEAKRRRVTNYKCAIVYRSWTRLRLRLRTNVLVGRRNTEALRFELRYLPNKRWCSKRDKQDICRAILVLLLCREHCTRKLFIDELNASGVNICEDEIPLVPSTTLVLLQ